MRQVQEMSVEFVNALNVAAAAESECAKLRRLLEEERKLVQRLKQEKEDEAQMGKRKIGRMSQRLAEAQKDVECATARADVAENEWVKLKRELQEALEHVQLLKPESEGTRQIVLRQGHDNELELADAINPVSYSESECDKLRALLEEERKLVQRLTLENGDEAQLANRQIEEISLELAEARKEAEYATTRADLAETEWIKAKKGLREERKLSQCLERECDEIRRNATTQVEEKKQLLVGALRACAIAELECDKLKRMLEEKQNLVQRVILEKNDEVQLTKRIEELYQEFRKDAGLEDADVDAEESECAKLRRLLEEERRHVQRLKQETEDEAQMARTDGKRKIGRMSQRLTEAQKVVEYATARFDVAENEWVRLKRELREALDHMQLLKPEGEETRPIVLKQGDDNELGLANAAISESECDKLRTLLEEERKLVQRLKLVNDDEAQLAKRKIEVISQELADARKEAEYATTRADVAESECDKLKRMLEEEQNLVQKLILEKDDEMQLTKRQIEEIDQELAHAQKDAELARKDADAAENEWTKVKKDLKNMEEHVKWLELQCQEIRESFSRKGGEKALELANALNASAIAEKECAKLKRTLIEEKKTVHRLINYDEAELAKTEIEKMGRELAHARKEAQYARNDADIAVNKWIKAKKDLQEKLELIQLLKLECRETSERAMRQVEAKELELADALYAATSASSSSTVTQDCVFCLTNEKNMAFGCGHMSSDAEL